MAQTGRSLFRRIRTVKSSLENAERSFKDNQELRGELDLMLAEAELKNLRRKQDVPWNWNRQLFAGCAALLLVLAGVGGWYFARGHYKQRQSPPPTKAQALTQAAALKQEASLKAREQAPATNETINTQATDSSPQPKQEEQSQVKISKADMQRLVRSARVELSNSR